ncbi:MAG: Crp/Fnr family transcriptional regulator [Bacteroidia bacterium]|nr:Crp/Fnr family transcriptional regulator [Bacteroidia bacterium]
MMKPFIFTDPLLLAELNKYSRTKTFEKDAVLIYPGDEITYLPIVLKGSVRVIREDSGLKGQFLYHILAGQTCAMSLTCCQSGKKSMIKAVAEEQSEVMLVSVKETEGWFIYPEWRSFVSESYGLRLKELLEVIDLIAFSNMDNQLFHYLNQRARANNTNVLKITHQQIADELHTHREAISRLLRIMEEKQIVRLGRNSIELLQYYVSNVPDGRET